MLRAFINHVENIFIQRMLINNRCESTNDSNNTVKAINSYYFMFSQEIMEFTKRVAYCDSVVQYKINA